jgi:hypothetical protein
VVDAFQARSTSRSLVDLGSTPRATASAASVFASNDILQRYQPSGASAATAAQDRLSPGVGASHRMADTDRSRLLPHKEKLVSAAQRHGENDSRFGFVNDVAGEFWHWTYTRNPARMAAVPSVAELSAGGAHTHTPGGGCC